MRTIDIHAHPVPHSLWQAADAGTAWHGFRHEPGEGVGVIVGGGKRHGFVSPKVRFTPEERLQDMDVQKVDVQVLSYDSVVGSEEALRFLLDQVGVDRVVLGSDWPFVSWHPSPVARVQGLPTITADEERILWRNVEALLGL
jgi:hypothetical protein